MALSHSGILPRGMKAGGSIAARKGSTGAAKTPRQSQMDQGQKTTCQKKLHEFLDACEVFAQFMHCIRFPNNEQRREIHDRILNDLRVPYSIFKHREQRLILGDRVTELGLVPLLVKYYETSLKHFRLNAVTCYRSDTAWTTELSNLRSFFWDYSDASPQFAEQLARSGYLKLMMRDLDVIQIGIQNDIIDESNKETLEAVQTAIAPVYNCSRLEITKDIFRELNVVERIKPYLQSCDAKIKAEATLIKWYIIEEEQNDLLTTDETVFEFLINGLKCALDAENNRFRGLSTSELAEGLGVLARNDKSKAAIGQHGALPLLSRMLESTDEEDVEQAAKTLWKLSFVQENKAKIKEDTKCVDRLRKFSRHYRHEIKKAASGVLWTLEQELDTVRLQEDTSTDNLKFALVASGICIQRFSMDHHGGFVYLKELGVTLVVPRGSLPEEKVIEMYLGVSWKPGDSPHLTGKQTRTSPIVVCGPHDLTFLKPVYLSFPHCIQRVEDAGTEMTFWTSKTDLLGSCQWITDENDPVVFYSQTRCTAALWNLCKYTTSSNRRRVLAAAFGEFDPGTNLLQIAVNCISDTADEITVLSSWMERMGLKRIVLDGFFRLYICPHGDGDQGDDDHDNNEHIVCEDDHDILVTIKDFQGWTLRGEDEKALDYQKMIDESRPYCTFSLNPESTTPCPKIFTGKILVAQQGLKGREARLSSVELDVCRPLHEITKVPGTEQLGIQALQSSNPDTRLFWGNQPQRTIEPLQQQSVLNSSSPGTSGPLQLHSVLNPSAPHQWDLPAAGLPYHLAHGVEAFKQHQQPLEQYVHHQPPQLHGGHNPQTIPHLPQTTHYGGPDPRQKQNIAIAEPPFPRGLVNFPQEQAKPNMLMQQLPQTCNNKSPGEISPSELNLPSLSIPAGDHGQSDSTSIITPEPISGLPNAMAQSTQLMLEQQNSAEVSIPSPQNNLEQLSLSESADPSPSGDTKDHIHPLPIDPMRVLHNVSNVPSVTPEGHMGKSVLNPEHHPQEVAQSFIIAPLRVSHSSAVSETASAPKNQDYEAYPIVETPSQLEISQQQRHFQEELHAQHHRFPQLSSPPLQQQQQQLPHPYALYAVSQHYGRPDLSQPLCTAAPQTNMTVAYGCGAAARWTETAGQHNVFVQNVGRLEIHQNGDRELMGAAPPAHVHVLQRYLPLGAKGHLDRFLKIPQVWETIICQLHLRNAGCPKEPVEFVFCHLQGSFQLLIWLLRKIGEGVKKIVEQPEIEVLIDEVRKARIREVECENLRKNLSYIADEGFNIRRLLDFLFSKGIISDSDMDKIKCQQASSEKCSLLLHKILKCSVDKDPVGHLRQWFVDEDRRDLADLLVVNPEDIQGSYDPDDALRPDEYQDGHLALRQN